MYSVPNNTLWQASLSCFRTHLFVLARFHNKNGSKFRYQIDIYDAEAEPQIVLNKKTNFFNPFPLVCINDSENLQ